MTTSNSAVFSDFRLTPYLSLKNKVIMAPMTRANATESSLPTKKMVDYYARRAAVGLIVSEGTLINSEAMNCARVPGIYNEDQITAWRPIIDAVHQNGGHFFMQLWHVGRASHPHFLNGKLPIAPSATEMKGRLYRSENLFYGKSRAATLDELKQLKLDYTNAAKNAISAGSDGIELHGANGYLLDQFLHYDTNKRTDEYGQTPENMSRFVLEVVNAVGEAIGFEKVGLRLSPGAYLNEIVGDERDKSVFAYLLSQLNNLPLAYVHTGNFDDSVLFKELDNMTMTEFLRKHYKGTLIACGGYDLETGENHIAKGDFDLVAIGRPLIANPNLIDQFKKSEEIKEYDPVMLKTLY
jgi:N-ethylmaleimide reductase